MSKMEILAELPKLKLADRREIFDRICEIEEHDLVNGSGATAEEKALLDRELEEYRRNPEAGSPWNEVESRIRKSSRL
jgi:putative addiction module component (TIGR02574 family)